MKINSGPTKLALLQPRAGPPFLKQPPSQSLQYTYCYYAFQKAHEFCQKKFFSMMLPEQQQPGKGRAGQEELEEKNFEEEEALGISWREESSRRAALQMMQRSDYYS